ncbi:hypothetical protein [Mesorhizobium loti]|uniref:hypothetical protein n=1 Tax=Rhizobium loti TaxID=381 RepID=UPI000416A016|nr:hypothetical protein [Mesorhizobium loti]
MSDLFGRMKGKVLVITSWVQGGLPILRGLWLLLTVIVLVLLSFRFAPFYPFETRGAIYVGSPEVYTRERLVNDRYDQDYWYRAQLKLLDLSNSLVTGVTSNRMHLSVGADKLPDPASPIDTEKTQLILPYDQEFSIRAGIRDKIRALILENMLDDRHDLTGNSIYGLKFDSTVIPGQNTNKRAFVRVSIHLTEPFLASEPGEPLPKVMKLYLDGKSGRFDESLSPEIRQSALLYQNWLDSIYERLNNYYRRYETAGKLISAGDCSADNLRAQSNRVTTDVLASVLGIYLDPHELDAAAESGQGVLLPIPEPWSDLIQIQRFGGLTCDSPRLHFAVYTVTDSLYLFPKIDKVIPSWAATSYEDSGVNDEKWIVALFGRGSDASLAYNVRFHYPISSDLISYMTNKGKLLESCQPSEDRCERRLRILTLQSGFFNFVEKISKTDAYVYALFPKTESVAVMNDTEHGADAASSGISPSLPNTWIKVVESRRDTRSETSLVGYGDGGTERSDDTSESSSRENDVAFGWVFDGLQGTAVQKSELALVSVPAWTNELKLHVSVGWLDRQSREQPMKDFSMTIQLPPDYEAFDQFVAGEQSQRGPKILDAFMDQTQLSACQEGSILIPGFRLWRSSSVTLGSQLADRIIVLPNMQGIVAHFNSVDAPSSIDASGSSSLPLEVWTSEGTSTAKNKVVVRMTNVTSDAHGTACPVDPKSQMSDKDPKG